MNAEEGINGSYGSLLWVQTIMCGEPHVETCANKGYVFWQKVCPSVF